MAIEIQEITAEQTYPLRHKILRPHQPIMKSRYSKDSDPKSFHFGAFVNGEIVGVVSCELETSPLFQEDLQFRIRGMAVEKELRRQGIGAQLIVAAEQGLKKHNARLVWFNAREVAFSFYESMGYEYASDMFEIEDIGPHRVMFKRFI